MDMATLTWATTTTAGQSRIPSTTDWVTTTTSGTLMALVECGATLQTLTKDMITALYLSVEQVC